MLKLSDIFSVRSLKNKRLQVALLDPQDRLSPLTAEGATKEEAIETLLEKMRRVFRPQPWEPLLLERGGYRVMIYPTPFGWRTNMVYATSDGITYEVSPSDVSAEPTRRDAERQARRQLAQLSWQLGEKESPVLLPDDEEGQRDFASWVAFQERYCSAQGQGFNNGEAHYAAGGFLDMAKELRAKRELAEAERRELALASKAQGEDETAVDLAMRVKALLARSSIYRRARTLAEELQDSPQQVERALALLLGCGWVVSTEMDGEQQYLLVPRRQPETDEMRPGSATERGPRPV